ncbi:MAG: hypothetical protein COV74_05835 [Candidatus Omnitrophica bacterium CG11_big_fil_rev_8_21_14_0_20_45_26]|uniref:histidine kinase n=1 Tax=Candidatus Abzuiibacterium crystallinum TaxID=1974748 RepID=A0A2H0LRU2_9BACT|nr:MAG: hypothetical protein COV74_05835 [Candidatus Omnitrophica bacterium CG11_big_fil_rev_8_21_14_0_20_45_26]PIW64089.1 MAG: hypothetical protein COW12_07570 [Candidatus Omnitrophica bacterium CG12_big_fil_rev_8_21_14_0_65_45_16]
MAFQSEDLSTPELKIGFYRIFLLLAGILYPVWGFAFEAWVPGIQDDKLGRLVIGAICLFFFGLSYILPRVARHTELIFSFLGWIMTTHYFVLLYQNHVHSTYAMGMFVTIFAIGACLNRRRVLLAYSVYVVLLSGLIYFIDTDFVRPIFLMGVVTTVVVTYLAAADRLVSLNKLREDEEAIRREKMRTDLILNSTDEGIYCLDKTGKTTFINEAAARIIGWEPEEFVGKLEHDVLHHTKEDGRPFGTAKCPIFQTFTGGVSRHVNDELFWRRDGSYFPVEYTSTPLKEGYEVVGAVVTFRDISKRRESEASLKKLSNVVQQTAEAVVITDRDGVIEYVNPTFEQLTGFSAQEAVGQNPRLLKSGRHPKVFYERFWKTILNGDVYRGIFINKKKSGEIYYEEQTVTPLRNEQGDITHFVSTSHDFTDRIKAEQALQMANEKLRVQSNDLIKTNEGIRTLYRELKKSHEDLKVLQNQLVQAEKLQSIGRLAAGVAHEVKNPLNILVQQIDYLSDLIPKKDKEAAKVLEEMEEAVDRASTIISELLDFSRMSELDLKKVSLMEVMDSTLTLLEPQLKTAKINLKKEYDKRLPKVNLDANRMQQVFINLMMNAIHATEPGSALTIRLFPRTLNRFEPFVGRRREDIFSIGDDVAVIEIEDAGTGISEENMPKIFDPFFTTKREKGGTGLGLSVVKNILDLHHATIELINNQNGKGAKAVIMIKLDAHSKS